MAGHSNVAHSSHLYPTSTPGWHVKTRVCPPLVAPISPSPRSVPRSFSTETSLPIRSHDAPQMLGPWRVAHSSIHSPTRPHENRPTRPQDTLESYHAISAGSSKMPLRGDKTDLFKLNFKKWCKNTTANPCAHLPAVFLST